MEIKESEEIEDLMVFLAKEEELAILVFQEIGVNQVILVNQLDLQQVVISVKEENVALKALLEI